MVVRKDVLGSMGDVPNDYVVVLVTLCLPLYYTYAYHYTTLGVQFQMPMPEKGHSSISIQGDSSEIFLALCLSECLKMGKCLIRTKGITKLTFEQTINEIAPSQLKYFILCRKGGLL